MMINRDELARKIGEAIEALDKRQCDNICEAYNCKECRLKFLAEHLINNKLEEVMKKGDPKSP